TFCNGDDQLAVELLYDLNIEGRGGMLLGRNEQGNNGENGNQRCRGPAPLRLFDIADGHGDQMGINVGLDASGGVAPAGMTDFQRRMMSRARKKAKVKSLQQLFVVNALILIIQQSHLTCIVHLFCDAISITHFHRER
ncbi:hypothetical protein FOZ62_018082, partial [Perkinsus olseni]